LHHTPPGVQNQRVNEIVAKWIVRRKSSKATMGSESQGPRMVGNRRNEKRKISAIIGQGNSVEGVPYPLSKQEACAGAVTREPAWTTVERQEKIVKPNHKNKTKELGMVRDNKVPLGMVQESEECS